MAGGCPSRQKLLCIVPPAVPAAAIIITVFFFAAIGTQPESAGVCGGWCGWYERHIRQGHDGRGGGGRHNKSKAAVLGSVCCAAGGWAFRLHHAGLAATAYGVGIRKRAGCPLLFCLILFPLPLHRPHRMSPAGPIGGACPVAKKCISLCGGELPCMASWGGKLTGRWQNSKKRGSTGGNFAEPAQVRLSVGKNLQKLLNSFFWGCYGLFRGRDELFRALPSPLRYHKRVFFTSFVRVQKLKVFAGWTSRV